MVHRAQGGKMGVKHLLSLTHQLMPSKLQLATDGYYPGLARTERRWSIFPIMRMVGRTGSTPICNLRDPASPHLFTIINADTANADDTVNSGVQNFRQIRFLISQQPVMGDGYFAYDFGPQNHGQTWWYDEYDNGAGSSLSRPLNMSQTKLFLAADTGAQFKVGDVVSVPDDISLGGASEDKDEQMLHHQREP